MTVKVDVARTCPTLLSAWMLEYGVGYYVEPPTQENSLGGRTLAVYTLQAQLVAPGDPDSFTRFRPYLAHFPPVFCRFCAFSPSRRGGSNEPQAGAHGQETAARAPKHRFAGLANPGCWERMEDQLHVALLGHADDVLHRPEPQFRAREI